MGNWKKILGIAWAFCPGLFVAASGQELCKYIVVDQFGYLPDSRKVAVLRNPQTGFDAEESYSPGAWFAVVDARTEEKVYRARMKPWNEGREDPSSGDMVWHFDFTPLSDTGTYYVLDEENRLRSYDFVIAPDVYKEVLRQAMRTFFYQRAGYPKEVPYAAPAWADGASHTGDLQDPNCRFWFDKDNPDTERDVSGGWYDAGDFNKYTLWTSDYVVTFMHAYLEKPDAWGDDYGIPESGNGRPDILDEALYGIDHLLRLQLPDGGVLSIVGEAHGSPPSSATGPSYYGPPSTSATLGVAGVFALASRVYREQGMPACADTLLRHAVMAWDWAQRFPDSLFFNNREEYGSGGLGAGQVETRDYRRAMERLEAACYLFRETGNTAYREYFDGHYRECRLFRRNGRASMFDTGPQDVVLYYTTLPQGTPSIREEIRDAYRYAVMHGPDCLPAYTGERDPYLAYAESYTWGSNGNKAGKGSMHYHLITFGLAGPSERDARDAAEGYLHNLHGVNPLNLVYLSNMYAYGAENAVNEFYHSWFTDGSPLWDRVGESEYGPAPGYLTGGPNPRYDWDDCCPAGCSSEENNALCFSESIFPPKDQPAQKSYKQFNTGWPLNSWEITENSCSYQTRYIRLLSKFVTAVTH